MRIDNETEGCDRCGMVLHSSLAQFHQCKGTDTRLRPANISETDWLAAYRVQLDISSLFGSAPVRSVDKMEEAADLLNRVADVAQHEPAWSKGVGVLLYTIAGLSALGGLMAWVMWMLEHMKR